MCRNGDTRKQNGHVFQFSFFPLLFLSLIHNSSGAAPSCLVNRRGRKVIRLKPSNYVQTSLPRPCLTQLSSGESLE